MPRRACCGGWRRFAHGSAGQRSSTPTASRLRVGRYKEDTTAEDLQALKDAVKNIGRDIGALLPEGMPIEIINAAATIGGTSDYFARMVDTSDKQVEIEVLGQTASTEGTPGQLGGNKAQDRVRRDIALADAIALGHTQTDQLVGAVRALQLWR